MALVKFGEMSLEQMQLERKFKESENDKVMLVQRVQHANSEAVNLRSIVSQQRDKVEKMEKKLKDLQKAVATHVESKFKVEEVMSEVALKTDLHKQNKELDALQKVTRDLANKVGPGSGGAGGPNSGHLHRLEQTVAHHDVRLAEYDMRFHVLETASFDGILLWKIKDYDRRKNEAVGNRVISLYSQPFYTSRHGYKMCARIYLNGDGMGKGTHISLFFVVMQGEYDDLLKWPFRQKVTLMLMDQDGTGKHLHDSFRPDPTSSSFQKPRSNMNVASGCPLFVSQTVVEGANSPYKKNDCIFIKVIVDTRDLSDP